MLRAKWLENHVGRVETNRYNRLMRIFGIRVVRLLKESPAGVRGDLSIRHFHNGKIATKAKVGTELHRDTNTWQHRERYIDMLHQYDKHSYNEKIINPTTGDYMEKDEVYADHRKSKGRKRTQ